MQHKHLGCDSGINDNSSDDDWLNFLKNMAEENDSYENCDLYTELHRDVDLEVKLDLSDKSDILNICPVCHENTILTNSMYCVNCGVENFEHNDSKFNHNIDKNHNTSVGSFMSFNVIGKSSYYYQRSLLKTCANYSAFRKNSNRKDLEDCNFQYEGKKIPKCAIKLAIELFSKIKEKGYVFRGNKKKGVIGSCLFYACIMFNMTKTPREIASLLNIEDRFLSQGDKQIQEKNEKGIIDIPTTFRPLNDYINQYFPTFSIPDKYKQFIIDLIEYAEKKNIHILNDSRTTTKCIGAIYLLVSRVKELNHIKKIIVSDEQSIKKNTFIKYTNLLISNHNLLKPVFKKHRIPMPKEWKGK